MNQKKDSKPAKKPRRRKGTNSFAQASTRFGGAGPAVVATVLEAVYRLQVVSGIDPGIEFTEPIRRYSASTLVCGDARATDTVRELYNVFVAPVKSLKDSMTSVQDLVQRIILPPRGGVNMATIFFKDPARLQELARLMTPALFLAVLVSLVGNAGAAALESAPGVVGLSAWSSAGPLQLAASLFQTLFVTYLIVSTLHFMKVLIADRDRILAKSITETAKRLQTENDAPVTVCAVVGLLHVNGILRLLQEESNVFQD